jgi:hypothetical protein
MSNHLGLNIYSFKLFPVMNQDIMTDKVREHNHVSAMGSDEISLFHAFNIVHEFVLIRG